MRCAGPGHGAGRRGGRDRRARPARPRPRHRYVLDGTAAAIHAQQKRIRGTPFGEYDGKLADSEAVLEVDAAFGPDVCFNASQLETYISCPFQFFTKYVLKLEVRSTRPDELDEDHRAGQQDPQHARDSAARSSKDWPTRIWSRRIAIALEDREGPARRSRPAWTWVSGKSARGHLNGRMRLSSGNGWLTAAREVPSTPFDSSSSSESATRPIRSSSSATAAAC